MLRNWLQDPHSFLSLSDLLWSEFIFYVSNEDPSESNSMGNLLCGDIFIPHATIHESVFKKSKWNNSKSMIRNL